MQYFKMMALTFVILLAATLLNACTPQIVYVDRVEHIGIDQSLAIDMIKPRPIATEQYLNKTVAERESYLISYINKLNQVIDGGNIRFGLLLEYDKRQLKPPLKE